MSENLNLNGTLRYGGGEISDISASQMKGNELAIQQLINNHNLVAGAYKELQSRYERLLKQTSKGINRFDIALFCNGISLFGTIIVAIGVNLITDDKTGLGTIITILGGVIVLSVIAFQLRATYAIGEGSNASEG